MKQFEENLKKRQKSSLKKQDREKEYLRDLHDNIEEKNTKFMQKLEELKRKQSIMLTVGKIEPEIPENFPKNYFVQIVYEDVNLSGNQKFVDFDENVIDEKFVLPLLGSSVVRMEIMIDDENQQKAPTMFDRVELDLEREIPMALKKDKHEGSC